MNSKSTKCVHCARDLEGDEVRTGLCTSDDCIRHDLKTNWEPLAWKPLWDAMDSYPTEWIPTTEAMYWEMLECVPPRAHSGGAFLVGEALRHNDEGKAVHACFKQVGNSYFAKNLTVEQFRAGV